MAYLVVQALYLDCSLREGLDNSPVEASLYFRVFCNTNNGLPHNNVLYFSNQPVVNNGFPDETSLVDGDASSDELLDVQGDSELRRLPQD